MLHINFSWTYATAYGFPEKGLRYVLRRNKLWRVSNYKPGLVISQVLGLPAEIFIGIRFIVRIKKKLAVSNHSF